MMLKISYLVAGNKNMIVFLLLIEKSVKAILKYLVLDINLFSPTNHLLLL